MSSASLGGNDNSAKKQILLLILAFIVLLAACFLLPSCNAEKRLQKKVVKRGAQFSKARVKLMAIPVLGPIAEVDSSLVWHPIIIGPAKQTVKETTETEIGKQAPPAKIGVNIDSLFQAGVKSVIITCPDCPPEKIVKTTRTVTDSIPYESSARLDSMKLDSKKKDKQIALLNALNVNISKQNTINHNSVVKWRKRALYTWIPLALLVGGAVAFKMLKPKIPFTR